MRTPPKLAAALLKRLGPGNDALAGDVLEQFKEGRSRLWLWRQVLGAVLRGIVADIPSHPVLTLRGVILGFGLIYVVSNAVFAALRLPEELFTRGIIRWLYLNGYAPPDWVRLFRVWPWIGLTLPNRSMSLAQLVVDLMVLYPLAIIAGGICAARTTAPQRAGRAGDPA